MLQKYVYNSTVLFFNILLFSLKGYSETLRVLPASSHLFLIKFQVAEVDLSCYCYKCNLWASSFAEIKKFESKDEIYHA